MEWASIVVLGFLLVFLGVTLIFVGVLKASLEGGARVEGGGVVMIGPIPIIFGSSFRAAIVAMVLALALMVVALLLSRGWAPGG